MRRPVATVVAALLLTAACSSRNGEPEQQRAEGAPTLQAMVGTDEDPDAFEISLVDEDGHPVTELPAGTYNVEVDDPSGIHDFHLSGGDGAVDEKTSPPEKIETLWVLDLEPGQYRFMCDPHPSMNGSFTVT